MSNSLATVDAAAPHIGSAWQPLTLIRPRSLPAKNLAMAWAHGSGDNAGVVNIAVPDNRPGYPNDGSPYNFGLFRALADAGIPVIAHQLEGINPATGVADVQQFASRQVMDCFESCRVNWAGRLGCRTDKVIVAGASQGSGDALYYLLQYPQNVAAVFLHLPGADNEGDRYGPHGTSINQNWGFPSPYNQKPTMAWVNPDGSHSPLTIRAYAVGTVYNVNDLVVDKVNVGPIPGSGFMTTAWRRVVAGQAAASNVSLDAGWEPLDPWGIHFTTTLEGGSSLTFEPGTPLAGQPASLSDPSQMQRMRDIISGAFTGTPVPVIACYSPGDAVSCGQGVQGVQTNFPWYAAQVGIDARPIGPGNLNHAGHPQPSDPQYAVVAALTSGQNRAFVAGANHEFVVNVTGTWTGSLAVELSNDGAAWTAVPVPAGTAGPWLRSTVATLAVDDGWSGAAGGGTEGAAKATITSNGYWRIDSTGYTQMRIRRPSGTGTATVSGGVSYPNDVQAGAIDVPTIVHDLLKRAA